MQFDNLKRLQLVSFFSLPIFASLFLYPLTQQVAALVPLAILLSLAIFLFPKYFVLLLPFLGALTGWYLQVSGVNVRLEQALGVALALVGLIHLSLGKIQWRKSRINYFLYSFIAINLLSSVLSQEPKSSLFQLANISSSILIYFVVLNFIQTKEEYQLFLKAMLIAGFCAMLYGLLLFVFGMLGFDVPGVNIEVSEIAYGIYGSMREPNIFGSYSGSLLMIGLTLLFSVDAPSVFSKRFTKIFSMVAVFALLLSFARAAWVGAICGILVLLRYRKLWAQRYPFRLWGILGLVLPLVVFLFASGVVPSEFYLYKIQNLFNFDEGTGKYRALIWVKAWLNFIDHPFLGNGTFSYAYLNIEDAIPGGPEGNAWISNLGLLVLHDTGIVGIVVFICLLWSIFRESIQTIKSTLNVGLKYQALAFQVALVLLLVAYQATSAFSYGFTWILIAMIPLSKVHLESEETIWKKPLL